MTPADIEAIARRAGVNLEDGAPLWSEVVAMLALVRDEALEEAAKEMDDVGAHAVADHIRALKEAK